MSLRAFTFVTKNVLFRLGSDDVPVVKQRTKHMLIYIVFFFNLNSPVVDSPFFLKIYIFQ